MTERKIRSASRKTAKTAGALKRKKAVKSAVRLVRGPVYQSNGNAMYLYRIIGGDRRNVTLQALEKADQSVAPYAPVELSRDRARELLSLVKPGA